MNQSSPVRLFLTERALQDVRDIESYSIEQWGKQAAGKYMARIEAALDRIVERPELLQRNRTSPSLSDSHRAFRSTFSYATCKRMRFTC